MGLRQDIEALMGKHIKQVQVSPHRFLSEGPILDEVPHFKAFENALVVYISTRLQEAFKDGYKKGSDQLEIDTYNDYL